MASMNKIIHPMQRDRSHGDRNMTDGIEPLLARDEPAPFALENAGGASPILLVCEHAGRRVPAALGTLGLAAEQLGRHFMWDIGALDLARALAARLDAPLVHQRYSRMVCDCNRRPDVESYIPTHGEGVPVPGNAALDEAGRARRTAAIWKPFHDSLSSLLDAREAERRPTLLVTVHSFTPVFHGARRPWHAGVLFDRDAELSPRLFDVLAARHGELVGRNEPYSMSRETDYTVPVHGEDRALRCTEIEVRNDLIGTPAGVQTWAATLAAALRAACRDMGVEA